MKPSPGALTEALQRRTVREAEKEKVKKKKKEVKMRGGVKELGGKAELIK